MHRVKTITVGLSLALALHLLPGFRNPRVIDGVVLGLVGKEDDAWKVRKAKQISFFLSIISDSHQHVGRNRPERVGCLIGGDVDIIIIDHARPQTENDVEWAVTDR